VEAALAPPSTFLASCSPVTSCPPLRVVLACHVALAWVARLAVALVLAGSGLVLAPAGDRVK
jgi:hypothetical protein